MRSRIASAAFAAALAAAPALAADPPCPKCADVACPAPAGRTVVKVFAVADLVVPIPDFAPTPQPAPQPRPAPPHARPVPVAVSWGYPVPTAAPAVPPHALFLRTMATMTPPAPVPAEDAVPPGGVRVVRAESPTTILLGGLKTCEPACPAPRACVPDGGTVVIGGLKVCQPPMPAARPLPAPSPAPCVTGDALVRVVTSAVRPASWKCAGGTGTVEFYPVGHSLVVHNSPEVVREVETLLDALRKTQDQTIAVECRLVSVPVGFAARAGLDFAAANSSPTVLLNDVQVFLWMEAVQGDRRVNVMQAPKITLFNGQTGHVSCECETKTFTTGLDVRTVDGQTVAVPKQETIALGTTLQVQPTLSADRRHVRLAFAVRQAELNEPVTLMPITHTVTPVFEGGSSGVPVPFTQFIQQPAVARRSAERTVTLPDGGTVAVPVGTRVVETRTEEFGPPVLSRVPYVNRLFKNVGLAREEHEVIALLTARVVTPCEEKACCASPAAGLVAEYRSACAAGKTEEAMKLALKALAADPGCFAK